MGIGGGQWGLGGPEENGGGQWAWGRGEEGMGTSQRGLGGCRGLREIGEGGGL